MKKRNAVRFGGNASDQRPRERKRERMKRGIPAKLWWQNAMVEKKRVHTNVSVVVVVVSRSPD